MLVGAAILPTAPVLVPGASATLPAGLPAVCDAIDAAVERLPDHDLLVLLAGDAGDTPTVYVSEEASLAPVGLTGIADPVRVDADAAHVCAEVLAGKVETSAVLPLDLAVLALLLGGHVPVVPVAVPAAARFGELTALGRRLAAAFHDEQAPRTVAVAAGDLSAGLTEQAPLALLPGAEDFDAAVLEAVETGRLDALAGLGPGEAERLGARGWAPMAALHGALEAAKLGLVRRHYSAPGGVGYLVAHGA